MPWGSFKSPPQADAIIGLPSRQIRLQVREEHVLPQLVLSVFISVGVSLALAPACIRLARHLGMMDLPDPMSYKIHTVATPRAGGMAILIAGLVAGLTTGFVWQQPMRSIFLAGLIIFVFGALDDARGMNAGTKLLGQGLATAVLIQSGVVVQILHSPMPDLALTVLWVVGVTNAYNFIDSMDGEALGLAGLAAGFLMLAMASTGQHQPALFGAAVIGACAGLLYFNVTPAKLFLGDSGSQLLGFWLAALGIVFTPVPAVPQLSSWFVPILIMIVPILDTTLVTWSRIRDRLPVYRGNRDHTYHRLIARGLSPQRAVFVIQLASTMAGCLAIISLSLPPLWANSVFLATLVLGLAAVIGLAQSRTPTAAQL